MKKNAKKIQHLCLVSLILLTACSKNTGQPMNHSTSIDIPAVKHIALPISAQKWTTWRCEDNSTLQTRYQNSERKQLKIRYQGQEQLLQRQPSSFPAVYENKNLSFFSDGKSAVIGQPRSAIVYQAGCRPQ